MPAHFRARVSIESRPQSRTVWVLLGGMLLVMGAFFLVSVNIGFARYAVTGLFWDRTDGTVVDARNSSAPTIQFSTRDGALHYFKEDYILLCAGRHSLCWIRNFSTGEPVPVVYDPRAPQRAFVHDWALNAGAITWFLEAGAGLFLVLMLAVIVRQKPMQASIEVATSAEPPE